MTVKKLKEMPERIPYSGTFELTQRCNLKCKMCLFRHEDCEFPVMKKQELTTQQWIDMAQQAADMGTMNLLITGGEPFLRTDFCQIWEGIYQLGFVITLYTNAVLVNERILDTLRKYPPHVISITLYGNSKETYQSVCGNGEAFDKAVRGIHMLQTLPSVIEFRGTIIKDNYHEAVSMEEFIEQEFGVKDSFTLTRIVNKSVRGACAQVETCRLSEEETVDLLLLKTKKRVKEIMGDIYNEERFSIMLHAEEKNEEPIMKYSLLGCSGGMNQYCITYDGKLLGCQMLDAFQVDALSEGLQKAWESFPFIVRLPAMNEKCETCDKRAYCPICPAVVYAETQSFNSLPEYVCNYTNILYERGRIFSDDRT